MDLATLAPIQVSQVKKRSPARPFRRPGGGCGCGWEGAQGSAPRVQTRQRSRRLDLPGKAPEQRQKVLQIQGKPPPATSPTSIGNGGTSLHTMRGARGGGGKAGGRGERARKKAKKKPMRLSRHPPLPQPQHVGAVQGLGWSRSEAAAAPGGTRHTHTRAHNRLRHCER